MDRGKYKYSFLDIRRKKIYVTDFGNRIILVFSVSGVDVDVIVVFFLPIGYFGLNVYP